VLDGDTIQVKMDGTEYRVRYIGINTPETDEGFGEESKDYNLHLVNGQDLFLIKDVSETDQYGRLLRYVFTGGVFVNLELLRSGYALEVAYPPDTACNDLFDTAEKEAKGAGSGIWKQVSGSVSAGIEITSVFFNGTAGQTEPDEYVEITNSGSLSVDLTGWYLKDQGNHRFLFPSQAMAPGEVCRIYTAEHHPETCGWSFDVQDSAVWNNDADCASLYDAAGYLVDEFCYPQP